MKITWRQDLATGNAGIDEQHRKLFSKIDDLIAACKEGKEKEEIVSLLSFLKNYISCHFSAEEEYQAQHEFPARMEHKRQHEILIRRLEKLESDYRQKGVELPVVTNSLMLTYEWLMHHVLKSDLEMARSCSTK